MILFLIFALICCCGFIHLEYDINDKIKNTNTIPYKLIVLKYFYFLGMIANIFNAFAI